MTAARARRIWDELRAPSEGYLDAQVRIERERPLTPREAEAADVLFAEFREALERLGRAVAS